MLTHWSNKYARPVVDRREQAIPVRENLLRGTKEIPSNEQRCMHAYLNVTWLESMLGQTNFAKYKLYHCFNTFNSKNIQIKQVET